MISYASCLFSTLFRLSVFVFLRIVRSFPLEILNSLIHITTQIPTGLAKFVLPTLYSLYISALFLSRNEDDLLKTDPGIVKRHGLYVCRLHSFRRVFPHQNHKQQVSRLFTVILTLPTTSRRLRLSSLLVNSLLLLASIEFAVEDYLYDAPDAVFTRLGAIYPDKAKLVIRYPHFKDPIHVVWRKVRGSPDAQIQPWTLGSPVMLSEAGDWVNSTTISPLWPNTVYECKSLILFASMAYFSPYLRFVGELG
jgi:alkaline phosphatase D